MDHAKWRSFAKGLALSAAYCTAYLAAWYNSLDQWFLPTGLRVAALLFLPFRYWPYVFIGDAAALLTVRGPKADQYGELWAYLSPFVLAPSIALAPLLLRTRLKKILSHVTWLPAITLAIAAWSTMCKLVVNFVLSGPSASDVPETFLKYVTGDCMGILMLVPPMMVWLQRDADEFLPKKFMLDTSIAIGMILVIYVATLPPEISASLRQLFLIMMILPAAGLTMLHGWRGAAVGVTAVNVSIGMALTDFNISGALDKDSYVVQQLLVVFAMILLCLGAMISKLFTKARRLGISEGHALELAQTSFLSTEHNLREKVLYMAQMQFGFDDYRKRLVTRLRANGHFDAAMDLNAEGVEQMEWFERHAAALYPIQIEQQGLFAALHSEAFARLWAGDAEVMLLVKGHPKSLSVGLQLAAYRSICNSFALLSESAPDRYEIRARTWQHRGRRGIAVFVTARPTTAAQPGEAGTLAALELEGRAKAYGGAVRRRHTHRISLSLVETVGGVSTRGTTLQQEPNPFRH